MRYFCSLNIVCPINQISHSSGTLTSMGYPDGNYPGNLNCQYQMRAPSDNQVIRLEFTRFKLATCNYWSCKNCGDTLQAVEFISIADEKNVARFSPWCSTTNNPQPTHIFSSGQNLFLNFHTDATSQDSGFRATYRSVAKNLGNVFGYCTLVTFVFFPRIKCERFRVAGNIRIIVFNVSVNPRNCYNMICHIKFLEC